MKWECQLVFRSKLTMHTAYDRRDNTEPASVTALAISKCSRFESEISRLRILKPVRVCQKCYTTLRYDKLARKKQHHAANKNTANIL
ncbi:WD repeat and FYVE domain-containing protein 3 [Portunus trituberculatus]|uniref:WD repeat and FYVE domain-containing protein 3 n=1 Tax=Portunus trituberculatus TaxID=210409 RepID=A0A5B7EAT0_PORTR|nr:WD repeat and FYVE domain-containing protein 3 [Portunus trituberculatus]